MALPSDLMFHIFACLHPTNELPPLSLVCKRWCIEASAKDLWRKLDFSDSFISPRAMRNIIVRHHDNVQSLLIRKASSIAICELIGLFQEATYQHLRMLAVTIEGVGMMGDVSRISLPGVETVSVKRSILCKNSDFPPEFFRVFPNLTYLHCEGFPALDYNAIAPMIPLLQHLNTGSISPPPDKFLAALQSWKLQSLFIPFCSYESALVDCLPDVLSELHSLRALVLPRYLIQAEDFAHLNKLKYLKVINNYWINQPWVIKINLPELKQLDMEMHVKDLAQQFEIELCCQSLENLSMTSCNISRFSCIAPNIKALDLSFSNITEEQVVTLLGSIANLKVLDIRQMTLSTGETKLGLIQVIAPLVAQIDSLFVTYSSSTRESMMEAVDSWELIDCCSLDDLICADVGLENRRANLESVSFMKCLLPPHVSVKLGPDGYWSHVNPTSESYLHLFRRDSPYNQLEGTWERVTNVKRIEVCPTNLKDDQLRTLLDHCTSCHTLRALDCTDLARISIDKPNLKRVILRGCKALKLVEVKTNLDKLDISHCTPACNIAVAEHVTIKKFIASFCQVVKVNWVFPTPGQMSIRIIRLVTDQMREELVVAVKKLAPGVPFLTIQCHPQCNTTEMADLFQSALSPIQITLRSTTRPRSRAHAPTMYRSPAFDYSTGSAHGLSDQLSKFV